MLKIESDQFTTEFLLIKSKHMRKRPYISTGYKDLFIFFAVTLVCNGWIVSVRIVFINRLTIAGNWEVGRLSGIIISLNLLKFTQ